MVLFSGGLCSLKLAKSDDLTLVYQDKKEKVTCTLLTSPDECVIDHGTKDKQPHYKARDF
jgi:hypothetical protein